MDFAGSLKVRFSQTSPSQNAERGRFCYVGKTFSCGLSGHRGKLLNVKRLAALVMIGMLLLTGCGGSGAKSYSGPDKVAAAIGCDDARPQAKADLEYGVDAEVDCELNGDDVYIQWFESNENAKHYQQAGSVVSSALGSLSDVFVNGPNWTIECEKPSVCHEVQRTIGGKYQG